MKKIWCRLMALVFTLLLCSGALAACTPSPEPVPPQTEMTPAQSEQPSEEPKVDDVDKYKFAVVPPLVHPFYNPFPKALEDASKDLGIPVATLKMPQNFNQNEQNVILDGLVAQGYRGIAVQLADTAAGNTQVTNMVQKGIPVIAFGAAPEQPSDAKFAVVSDVGTEAYVATKRLIEEMGGEGNLVHLTGQLADANSKPRMDAVQKAIDETGGKVTLLQTISDIDSAEASQNAVGALLAAKRSEIDGIVCTAYNPAVAVAAAFTESNERRIKSVGIDNDEIVLKAVKDGFMSGTLVKNAYGMAYVPVYALKKIADGYTYKSDAPFIIDVGSTVVDASGVDTVDQIMADLTKELLKQVDSYFQAP